MVREVVEEEEVASRVEESAATYATTGCAEDVTEETRVVLTTSKTARGRVGGAETAETIEETTEETIAAVMTDDVTTAATTIV